MGPKVTNPLTNEWNFAYDTKGQLTTMTDPRDKTTTFGYDPQYGDLTSITDPLQKAWNFSYTLGKLTTATDPLNHTTTYQYDGLGRLTRIIHPDTTEITYNRYCCGLESITDENGNIAQ